MHCGQDLAALDGVTLGCSSGHHFDANKRGYLTTLDSSKGITGDPLPLLEARARFLALGHYQAIADAVTAALPTERPLSVLDAGTGTGYYLSQVLAHSPAPHDALASDASAAAVRMAIAATGCAGLVADVWQASAVRSARADVILCVFAPRNPSEFSRILRDDGILVVVTPASDHLAELRAAGLMIGMHDDKLAKLDDALAPFFELTNRTRVDYQIPLGASAATDLTAMGPSGHHERVGAWAGGDVTVSVDCSVFSARSDRGSTRTANQ